MCRRWKICRDRPDPSVADTLTRRTRKLRRFELPERPLSQKLVKRRRRPDQLFQRRKHILWHLRRDHILTRVSEQVNAEKKKVDLEAKDYDLKDSFYG